MNSASKLLSGLFVGSFFWLCQPAMAEDAKADVPPPSTAPLAESNDMSDFVGEGQESTNPVQDASELLRLLQSGNNGQPLTISQLAKINDAIRRMEYLSELESKIESSGGGAGVAVVPKSDNSSESVAVIGSNSVDAYAVSSIFGSKGRFQAIVTDGKSELFVRQGDPLGNGTVARISANGVFVSSARGEVMLPFASGSLPSGIEARTR